MTFSTEFVSAYGPVYLGAGNLTLTVWRWSSLRTEVRSDLQTVDPSPVNHMHTTQTD